jgi:hypothetical protein
MSVDTELEEIMVAAALDGGGGAAAVNAVASLRERLGMAGRLRPPATSGDPSQVPWQRLMDGAQRPRWAGFAVAYADGSVEAVRLGQVGTPALLCIGDEADDVVRFDGAAIRTGVFELVVCAQALHPWPDGAAAARQVDETVTSAHHSLTLT